MLRYGVISLILVLLLRYTGQSQGYQIPFTLTCDFVHQDQQGRLWLGSTSGWYIYDGIRQPVRSDKYGLDYLNIQSNIFPGLGLEQWFASYNRLVRYHPLEDAMQPYPLVYATGDTMQSDYYLFHSNPAEQILLGKQGLKIFKYHFDLHQAEILADNITGRRVLPVVGNGKIYALSYYYTRTPQIVEWPDGDWSSTTVSYWTNWPDSCKAYDMVTYDGLQILIATDQGLMLGDLGTKSVLPIQHGDIHGEAICVARHSDKGWLVSFRDKGVFWVVSTRHPEDQTTYIRFEPFPQLAGAGNIDRIVVLDDGTIVLIEFGRSIYFYKPGIKKFKQYFHSTMLKSPFTSVSQEEWRYGHLSASWTVQTNEAVSIQGPGYVAISEQDGHATRLLQVSNGKNLLVNHPGGGRIFRYMTDESGILYGVFTKSELYRFQEKDWVEVEALAGEMDVHFYEKFDDIMLTAFNHERLIVRGHFRDTAIYNEIIFPGDIYNAIYNRNSLDIYLATDLGIARLAPPYRNIEIISPTRGHACDCLLPDKTGNLWYVSGSDLFLLQEMDQSPHRFSQADGLSGDRFTAGKCRRISEDSLIFFHASGLMLVQPSQLQWLSHEPRILFSTHMLDSLDVLDGEQLNYLSSWETNYARNTISFGVQSIDFSNPATTQVRYRLVGYDHDWIVNATPIALVRYPRLPPGQYQLEVNGSNSDGIWSDDVRTISIKVYPPFWQTWWFISLSGMAITFLVFRGIRMYYRRKLEKKNIQLREQALLIEKHKAVEHERTRIASEMHDDLGSGLTTIRYLSDRALRQAKDPGEAEHIRRISEHSNQLVRNMSEIIWAMNSRFDNAENLIGYLRRHASEFLHEHGMSYTFKVSPDELDDIQISGEKRRNVLLVFKEILHNTIKYSEAKSVEIVISATSVFEIRILEIGGKGFDPMLSLNKGNGLYNCQKRMETIGGTIQFVKGDETMEVVLCVSL